MAQGFLRDKSFDEITLSDNCNYASGIVTVGAGGGDVTIDLPFDWTDGYLEVHQTDTEASPIDGTTGHIMYVKTSYNELTNATYTNHQTVYMPNTGYGASVIKSTASPGWPKSATPTSFTLNDDGANTCYVKWFVWAPKSTTITMNSVMGKITQGSGVPATVPELIGDMYFDQQTGKMYVATGTSGTYNWALMAQGATDSFTKDSVPGIINWWKADGTLTKDGGNAVSQWNDETGNGDHMVQATSTNQPTYTENVINGRPALYFDGNDYLRKTSGCITTTVPATIFIVLLSPSSSTNQGVFGSSDNAYVYVGYPVDGYVGYFQYNNWNGGPAVPSTSSAYLYVVNCTGVANTGYMETNSGADKTLIANASSYGLFTATSRTIGANSNTLGDPFTGYIAEIIGYRGNLTDTNKNIVKNYLNSKYALY